MTCNMVTHLYGRGGARTSHERYVSSFFRHFCKLFRGQTRLTVGYMDFALTTRFESRIVFDDVACIGWRRLERCLDSCCIASSVRGACALHFWAERIPLEEGARRHGKHSLVLTITSRTLERRLKPPSLALRPKSFVKVSRSSALCVYAWVREGDCASFRRVHAGDVR